MFSKEVRRTFFDLLKPMLKEVDSFIDKNKKSDDPDTVFSKYFDKAQYIENFSGETSEAFAKELVGSS